MGDTNALLFTAKLSKERNKLCKERCDEYNELCAEYVNIEENMRILTKENRYLEATHDTLLNFTARCQCQSDDDQQLANNEVILTELDNKFNDIATIEMGDIRVENNNNDNQNVNQTISVDDELLQILVMRIKSLKEGIDISKQLIKVAEQLKLQYETSNTKLKHKMVTCNCGDDAHNGLELVKYREKRTSNDRNKQYSVLKEGSNAANNKYVNNREIEKSCSYSYRYSSIETKHKRKVTVNECLLKRRSDENAITAYNHNNENNVDNEEEKLMNGLAIESNNIYKCPRNCCDFVGTTLHALAVHKGHKHKRNKKKTKLRFVVKRNSVQRKPLNQRNTTLRSDKTRATNNNANLMYDQIIPNIMSAKNKKINQAKNSSLIGFTQCAANSPQMDKKLSPVADKTLKRRFPGSGFTDEEGVELKTYKQKSLKSNRKGNNSSAKQYKCCFSSCNFVGLSRVRIRKHIANHCSFLNCDFVGLSRAMFEKHVANHCYFPKCNFVALGRVMLKKHIANKHNWRNETAKSTHKSFACEYPNCVHSSDTEKGLRIHLKRIHGKSVAKNITHRQLSINRALIETQTKPIDEKPVFPNLILESTSAASPSGQKRRLQTARKSFPVPNH